MKKNKIGSIIRIATKYGIAFAQVVNYSEICDFMIRVLPGYYDDEFVNYEMLCLKKELYYTFIFSDDLNDPPNTKVVSRQKIPDRCAVFPLFRCGLRVPPHGKVENWWLWDGLKEWNIGKLDETMKYYPLREIWNSDILVNRIESGWRPQYET